MNKSFFFPSRASQIFFPPNFGHEKKWDFKFGLKIIRKDISFDLHELIWKKSLNIKTDRRNETVGDRKWVIMNGKKYLEVLYTKENNMKGDKEFHKLVPITKF